MSIARKSPWKMLQRGDRRERVLLRQCLADRLLRQQAGIFGESDEQHAIQDGLGVLDGGGSAYLRRRRVEVIDQAITKLLVVGVQGIGDLFVGPCAFI